MPVQANSATHKTVATAPANERDDASNPRMADRIHEHAPMNAGSTITSRDSHDVRHMAAARQARSGCPRCRRKRQPEVRSRRAR